LRAGALLASLADLDCYECDCEALRSGKARLALSDDIRSPILLGVFRPMIVFPADITSWTSPVERGAMLRHEMAHVERRDHYVNLFQTVLGAVFFFHPLARYACRQLAVEREIACDDHVVGSGAEAESYAESIIKAAERGIGAPHGAHRLALFSARQLLERRIEMILNRGRMRVFAHQWRYMFLFGAMIAAVSVLLISSRQSKIAAQSTINNDDGQEMIAMVRQMADRIAGDPGEDMSRKLDDFFGQIQSNETGEEIFQKLDDFAQQKFIVTRVEVDDFQVNPDGPGSYVKYTDGAKATVNFLSTIYLKNPFSREEKSIADRCAIEMVKAQGEWMAVPPPPPPPPPPQRHSKDVPPPPPPPPPDPWTLVVKLLQEGGGYRLNGIDFQSLEELRQRLNNALNGRPADKKTVLVQVYATIADDEVAKVFNTIRSAGGAPRLTWDPLSLVVTISQSGGSYKLNAINFSSLKDLSQRLYKALNGRPADKKTVYVRAAETIADEEVVKVFDAITAAGGRPIRIKK
ncbi:MAG: hypothetical protein J2P21_14155, partial [Chloracidobacterium sp.]|nr:hypothetical protein [Chloracidobacterium sp.]